MILQNKVKLKPNQAFNLKKMFKNAKIKASLNADKLNRTYNKLNSVNAAMILLFLGLPGFYGFIFLVSLVGG